MGIITVGTFVSVDGVYQSPGAPGEDREGGFEYGGWFARYDDPEVGDRIAAATFRPDAILLGRKTYDTFAGYWPNVGPDNPIAAKLNDTPKYVASRQLQSADWTNSTVLRGDDVPAQIAALKDRHQVIGVTGSGDLVQTLLEHDLVDELTLFVFPVLIGSGKRLFGSGTRPGALQLLECRCFGTGVVEQSYRRAGQLELGSFG